MSARELFRQTVADIAAKAKAKLPECNGRVEKAVSLVLAGDVDLHADGTATVFSSTDPTRRYELGSHADGYCMCKDWEQAPAHLCKHRIAAMIATRVQHTLPQAPAVATETAAGLQASTSVPHNDGPMTAQVAPPVAPAPASSAGQALPEAPVSITLKAHLHGHEVLVTLRGTDFASVKAQVEEASEWLKAQAPQSGPPLSTETTQGWCGKHNVRMRWYAAQGDKPATFLHKTSEGRWCKGR